jgi:hypothetical protein
MRVDGVELLSPNHQPDDERIATQPGCHEKPMLVFKNYWKNFMPPCIQR